MNLQRIVSGGQTGADRAALDAALGAKFPCGGWCPQDRSAEDGPLSGKYPLQELPGSGYRQRTIKNIEDSDATAIFYFGRPTGGTELTLVQCIRLHKPYQLIDASVILPNHAGQILHSFVQEHSVAVLNVAGPSEGRTPGTYSYVLPAVQSLIEVCRVGV